MNVRPPDGMFKDYDSWMMLMCYLFTLARLDTSVDKINDFLTSLPVCRLSDQLRKMGIISHMATTYLLFGFLRSIYV